LKVVILAGGRGQRYDSEKPKALSIIGNKAIIHHLMEIYAKQGYNEFILCLGWKQEDIINHLIRVPHNFKIDFVDTGQDSNTAKRLKLIQDYIPKEDKEFFCTYADGLANIDLMKLQARHITNKNIATLTAVRPTNNFGTLLFDNNGNVTEFKEKPKLKDYINGGFFIFNKKIFDYIDITKNQELEKDILTTLVNENELGAYKHEKMWVTVNTIKDEIYLNNILTKCTEEGKEPIWLDV